MKKVLDFADVTLEPAFSFVRESTALDLSTLFLGRATKLPFLMPAVGENHSHVLSRSGTLPFLDARLSSIEESCFKFQEAARDAKNPPVMKIGIGNDEFERAEALIAVGADILFIQSSYGANIEVLDQFTRIKELYRDRVRLVVGNFSTHTSLLSFLFHTSYKPDAISVGRSRGTVGDCGVGLPLFASLRECAGGNIPIVACDVEPGRDAVLALVAGASMLEIEYPDHFNILATETEKYIRTAMRLVNAVDLKELKEATLIQYSHDPHAEGL